MVIRNATEKDYNKIAEYSKQVVLHHVKNRPDIIKNAPELSKKEFKKIIKSENWILLVAETDNKTVGYCKALIRTVGDEIWTPCKFIFVYEMYVDPAFRRQGFANALFDEIKKTAATIGASKIELDVWSFNESAINLYKKLGFTPQRIKMEFEI